MMDDESFLSGDKSHRRQQDRRRRLSGEAGKGDAWRTTDMNKFRLGMRLIQLAEAGKKDTKEYKATLKAWRSA